jgi:phosphoadenosine phosphosulfate reductase
MLHRLTFDEKVIGLNSRFERQSAEAILRHTLLSGQFGNVGVVSSFGAESVVLLDLVAAIDPATPILFLDTEMLFAETLEYQKTIAERLGLTDVRVITPKREETFEKDNEGLLHLYFPDQCCALRKTIPVQQALEGFDTWITGRKRYQSGARARLAPFENEADRRIKVNPLAHWGTDEVQDYMAAKDLPRHPLVARGYPSIGCAPCTTQVGFGEDPRACRWRNQEKFECGIHFAGTNLVRDSAA